MRKLNNKAPIVFYVSMVLLCAVLISAYMTNDLYASYATYAFGGDSARVAKFDVEYTAKVGAVEIREIVDLGTISPGGIAKTIEVEVTNKSEVAVAANVYLTSLTGNLQRIQIRRSSSSPEVLPPNSGTNTIVVEIFWEKSENSADDLAKMGLPDMFELRITVEQVD